jgi:hypothetical protein
MDNDQIIDIAISIDGVPIRLTQERWFHIVENHNDLASYVDDVLDVVERPDIVLRGYNKSLIALRGYGHRQYLQVVYRQLSAQDGFIITAYFSSKWNEKQMIWKRQ